MNALMQILELARWAPSGDNTQPWRFAIEATDKVNVLGRDTRRHCVYDLDGHPSQISVGALLETIALAATRFGLVAHVSRRGDTPEEHPVFHVAFEPKAGLAEDRLVRFITERCVNRRPLGTRPLKPAEKQILEASVGNHFSIRWFEGWRDRGRFAWLNFRNAKLRLTLPEAYRTHRDTIEWETQFSEERIPAAAIGASKPSLELMRWAMQSWERISFLNRYLGATLAPRLELDLIPGLACAAHCVLLAHRAPESIDDYVAAGRALQRFWLTATSLGLQFQPGYTPLVFARYVRERRVFSAEPNALRSAEMIRRGLQDLLGAEWEPRAVFMGRIGTGRPADARSLRLQLPALIESTTCAAE